MVPWAAVRSELFILILGFRNGSSTPFFSCFLVLWSFMLFSGLIFLFIGIWACLWFGQSQVSSLIHLPF